MGKPISNPSRDILKNSVLNKSSINAVLCLQRRHREVKGLTIPDIEKKYKDEWLLFEVQEMDKLNNPMGVS
ncbi:unnamed protein product [marine sediment metagenome]|uniref:Uncharacterized protein n=1 Tax=marine sediment metagenome TaxID=412755 RepID=X1J8E2_9ZZZZ